eukprot:2953452-Alexandrium_andersonii.AAC.1
MHADQWPSRHRERPTNSQPVPAVLAHAKQPKVNQVHRSPGEQVADARTHARTHACTHARMHARTHACT